MSERMKPLDEAVVVKADRAARLRVKRLVRKRMKEIGRQKALSDEELRLAMRPSMEAIRGLHEMAEGKEMPRNAVAKHAAVRTLLEWGLAKPGAGAGGGEGGVKVVVNSYAAGSGGTAVVVAKVSDGATESED